MTLHVGRRRADSYGPYEGRHIIDTTLPSKRAHLRHVLSSRMAASKGKSAYLPQTSEGRSDGSVELEGPVEGGLGGQVCRSGAILGLCHLDISERG